MKSNRLICVLRHKKTEPLIAGAKKIGGIRFICENLGKTPLNIARVICDDIKSKYEDIVILIAAEENDDVKFISACGKTAVALGAHSGNIVKRVSAFTGGNGGGRPDNAMAGAKDKSKIEAALSEALVIIEEMINK